MATKAETIVSLERAKAHLRVAAADATRDAELTRLADGVSALLERETHRTFVQRSVTERRNGTGQRSLYLYRYPVVSITSLNVLRYPTDAAPELIPATSYWFDPDTGHLVLHSDRYTAGIGNVTVVYVAGEGLQDAVPGEAEMVALDIMRFLWEQREAGALAAQSVTIGQGSFVVRPEWPLHLKSGIKNLKRSGF